MREEYLDRVGVTGINETFSHQNAFERDTQSNSTSNSPQFPNDWTVFSYGGYGITFWMLFSVSLFLLIGIITIIVLICLIRRKRSHTKLQGKKLVIQVKELGHKDISEISDPKLKRRSM